MDDFTNEKIIHREAQRSLIEQTLSSEELLQSDILNSIVPSIGRNFAFADLEERKRNILLEARKRILQDCSLPEANRILKNLTEKCRSGKAQGFVKEDPRMRKARKIIEQKHSKKKNFFLSKDTSDTNNKEGKSRRRTLLT